MTNGHLCWQPGLFGFWGKLVCWLTGMACLFVVWLLAGGSLVCVSKSRTLRHALALFEEITTLGLQQDLSEARAALRAGMLRLDVGKFASVYLPLPKEQIFTP